jgi:hypothetical protein
MRHSDFYIVVSVLAAVALAALLWGYPRLTATYHRTLVAEKQRLVVQLALTDLCLFTEARYTRHPSQADLFAAFQDHPLALEHFPTGSLVLPPVHRLKTQEAAEVETVEEQTSALTSRFADRQGGKR